MVGPGRFLLSASAVIAVILAFTFIVDPYGVWPSFIGQFFPLKTARVNTVRLVKAYDLFKACPDHVISGMSTVVWGIDPETYPVSGKSLYNGGIVGSSVIEQYDYVMRYLKLCPNIKKVYIDANYASFSTFRINSKDFLTDRLQREIPLPTDVLFTNFTRTALKAAFDTVVQKETGIVNHMVYDKSNGFHRIPESTHDVYYRNFINLLSETFKSNERVAPLQLAYLKELVTELKSRGIEIVVFLGPTHPFLQYMRRFDGYKPQINSDAEYDNLKRQIAQITDFWDFNLYNRIVGEDIAKSDYFIDLIHYRPRLGTIVLEVLNGQRRAGLPANFGVLVTKDNVENFIFDFHKGIERWASDYPDYAKLVSNHFEHARSGYIPEFELRW